MSLRYLILGWLLERPCHGYELRQRLVPFEAGSSGLNEGRFYKILGDLEREDLIRHKVVPQEGLPSRKILHITPAGKATFRDWLRSPVPLQDDSRYEFFLRDPFLARYFFARRLGHAGLRELLRQHIQDIEARIREFTRLRRGPTEFPVTPARLEILALGLRYLVTKLRWLGKRLADLEASSPRVAASRRPRHPKAASPSRRGTRQSRGRDMTRK